MHSQNRKGNSKETKKIELQKDPDPFPKGTLKIFLPYVKNGEERMERIRDGLEYCLTNLFILKQTAINKFEADEVTLREESTEMTIELEVNPAVAESRSYNEQASKKRLYCGLFDFFEDQDLKAEKPPTITLLGDELYSREIICEKKVELEYFEFGNFIEGNFYLHFSHKYEPKLQQYRREDDDEDDYFHGATFQFDMRDFIRVCCEHKDNQGVQNYEIKIRESNIRKIILQKFDDEKRTCRLSIDLHSPPNLYRYKTDEELEEAKQRKNGNRNGDGSGNKENEGAEAAPKQKWRKPFITGSDRVTKLYNDTPESVFTEATHFTLGLSNVTIADVIAIVSRFHVRHKFDVEFTQAQSSNYPMISTIVQDWMYGHGKGFSEFESKVKAELQSYINKQGSEGNRCFFYIVYLVTALISRGSLVKDVLFMEKKREASAWIRFQSSIVEQLRNGSKNNKIYPAVIASLCRLIQLVDERHRIVDYSKMFERIFNQCLLNGTTIDLTDEDKKQKILLCCKLIITPTRMLMMPPEKIMGNRVLRTNNQDESRMVRFVLRDENYDKMHGMNMSKAMLEKTVRKAFKDNVVICKKIFVFIGSSSSQLRDAGGYLCEKYNAEGKDKIPSIRRGLGNFLDLQSVMKYLARLGQCFTSSFPSENVKLDQNQYEIIKDVEREGKDNKGRAVKYCFTDGVGMISLLLAEKLMKEFLSTNALESCPSAFQFRMGGAKGMLAVEPALTQPHLWRQRAVPKPYRKEGLHVVLRESQNKFDDVENRSKLVPEIVKYSTPCSVTLNRPLINILDQNTAKYGEAANESMKARILDLLDLEIKGSARALRDEAVALDRLTDMPHRIAYRYLHECGVSFINEPFFRSLLNASAKSTYHKLFMKSQIPIPKLLGRSMLGIVDETGLLEYGQVFVQFHESTKHKIPHAEAEKKVLKGKVVITKNPQITNGDVRLFDAVDIPELHHLVDVVVFPQKGDRPHPDEMAGSDLDGDEYSIIWDQQLLLEKNETAFNFATESHKERLDEATLSDKIVEFLVKYFEQDNVGHVAVNHLLVSEQYGLESKVALDLATKHDKAVNFSKSGIPPEPLTRNWSNLEPNNPRSDAIPPEVSERVPDFHHGKEMSPFYRSTSILGEVNRYIKRLEHIVELGENDMIDNEIALDLDFEYRPKELWDESDALDETGLMEKAKDMLREYNYALKEIMEYYGVMSEAEIFSGCIIELKNKSAQKDADDLAMFNLTHIIDFRMKELYQRFREKFFEDFGGWEQATRLPSDRRFPNDFFGDVFIRRVEKPSPRMQKMAELCYKLAYEEAKVATGTRLLSFGWIAYDVLAYMKKQNTPRDQRDNKDRRNCVNQLMSKHLIQARFEESSSLWDMFTQWLCTHFEDLAQKNPTMMQLIFGTIFNVTLDAMGKKVEELPRGILNLGPHLLDLIEFIGSRQFISTFKDSPKQKTIAKLNGAAFENYYNLIFNKRSLFRTDSQLLTIKEHPPFTIEIYELPDSGFGIEMIAQTLQAKLQLQDIHIRKQTNRRNFRFMVTARCTLKAYKALRETLIAEWRRPERTKKYHWEEMAQQVMLQVFKDTQHAEEVTKHLETKKNEAKQRGNLNGNGNRNANGNRNSGVQKSSSQSQQHSNTAHSLQRPNSFSPQAVPAQIDRQRHSEPYRDQGNARQLPRSSYRAGGGQGSHNQLSHNQQFDQFRQGIRQTGTQSNSTPPFLSRSRDGFTAARRSPTSARGTPTSPSSPYGFSSAPWNNYSNH